ncbi:hypothetical protein vseg_001250 [Gypsophila vaccaria]
MSSRFPTKVYKHLLVLLFSIWLTCCGGHGRTTEVTNNGIQCGESERAALLQFKQGIRVDNCGLLHSWGDSLDCCQWRGIRCSNRSGHVIRIHLPGIVGSDVLNYKGCLEGTLSDSLLELKHLKYLDLSINHFRGQLPKFIGSLSNLEHLNLSNDGFTGVVPQEIGNLSRLSSLDLNCYLSYYDDSNLRVQSLGWLSRLRLLKHLDLSDIDLSLAANTWLPIVNSLPFLQVLRLDDCHCHLSLKLPSSLSFINSSSTLNVISLSDNKMKDMSIFEWLFNLKGLENNLVYLDLSYNEMFGNNVQVSEGAVKFVGSLCRLQNLGFANTNLFYDFSDIVQTFSVCPHRSLAYLDLSGNQVWGHIPDNINTTLSSLKGLFADINQLNGTISQALSGLSMLESLNFEMNNLKGVVSEEHLSNLSKLSELNLGGNTELVVNISTNWIPPFQLDSLILYSCKIGPDFPMWLSTQKYLQAIDISNSSISSTLPISFLNSLSSKLQYLSMSKNMMRGIIPDVLIPLENPSLENPSKIDLSSNNFHGAIPRFVRNVTQLYLNDNRLSQGLVPLLCPQNKSPLVTLELSNNLFSDKLPDCWDYFDNLRVLHLQNNKLWGNLPTSIGRLDKLNILHLGNNNISGELPSSIVNCKSLIILDLSYNSIKGYIPSAFWDSFKNLGVLILQNNKFIGTLPSSLCRLPRVQILELSSNLISGTIPRCIHNLQAMADTTDELTNMLSDVYDYIIQDSYEGALVMWKRTEEFFAEGNSLGEVRTIGLSNNKLEGHIPEGISSLVGLVSINLSRNHLSGAITSKIGQLTSLEVLDISHNHLSGEIPSSLAKITTLAVLDLSYNNLSGKVPNGPQLQTFDSSAYMGNPGLCGAPLPKKCDNADSGQQDGDNATPRNQEDDHIDGFMLGLYISMVLGVITGFWAVCGTLLLKRSWRRAFFRFHDDVNDRIYVFMAFHAAKFWRRP